jgi:hypothetical protein
MKKERFERQTFKKLFEQDEKLAINYLEEKVKKNYIQWHWIFSKVKLTESFIRYALYKNFINNDKIKSFQLLYNTISSIVFYQSLSLDFLVELKELHTKYLVRTDECRVHAFKYITYDEFNYLVSLNKNTTEEIRKIYKDKHRVWNEEYEKKILVLDDEAFKKLTIRQKIYLD